MAFSSTTLAIALVLVLVGLAIAQGPALAPTTASTPAVAPVAAATPPVSADAPAEAPIDLAPPPALIANTPSTIEGVSPTGVPSIAPKGADNSGAFVHGTKWVVFGGVIALFA